MTRFLMIRHAATAFVGRRIAGRSDVPLSDAGRAQAERLADRLAAEKIAAVYTSPETRARETARPIAGRFRCLPIATSDLDEVDYGDWTGRALDELAALPEWRAYNSTRSLTRIPSGERIVDVQARVIDAIERLRARHGGQSLALVSHAEPIRAALAYYLGVAIDLSLRYDIDPASVSIVELYEDGPKIRCVNSTEAILG